MADVVDNLKSDIYTFIGNILNKDIGVRTSDMSTCLTFSNTKRGTDLGMLVVPYDQTFHPIHVFCVDNPI